MSNKATTEMEKRAISDARAGLLEALQHIGKVDVLNAFTKEDVLFMIEMIWARLRDSMQRQCDVDDIPF